MFKILLQRAISVTVALTVLVSSILTSVTALSTAGAIEVYPLLPMSVAATGGLNAELKASDKLFTNADVAVITAETPVINDADNILLSQAKFIMRGFSQRLTDVSHILLYVKLNKANIITLSAVMYDDYYAASGIPNLMLKNGAPYQFMALNGSTWKGADIVSGGLKFDAAFEGYVKIPITSLKEESSSVAVLPEIDYITGLNFRFLGVGGDYGSIEILPYLIVSDSDSSVIKVSENYEIPAEAKDIVTVTPITEVTRNKNSWQTVSGTEVTPLDFTRAFGVKMSPASGSLTEAANGNPADGQVYTGFNGDKLSATGSQGIVFYVKTDAANFIVPKFDVTKPTDTSRWKWSWTPIMVLAVGADYQYMPISGGEWKNGTAVVGRPGNNSYFGAIEFKEAFEGYIKIPYSSLANDSGFKFDASLDTFDRFIFALMGIGGSYGEPVVGPLFFLDSDGSEDIALNAEEPVKVTPLTGGNWRNFKLTTNEFKPTVDLTDENGMVMTPSDGAYEYTGTNLAGSQLLSSYYAPNGIKLDNSEGILVYLKLEAGNSLMPVIDIKDPGDSTRWRFSYPPAMLLKVGSLYQYLPKNGDKWLYGTAGVGKEGDNTYWGTIDFTEAFEGYVLIPYSSLVNDSGFVFDASLDSLTNFTFRIKGIGGNYGESITVGPLFKVNKNSDSAKIEIYTEDIPESAEKTELNPIKGQYSVSGMNAAETTPLAPITIKANSLSSGSPVDNVTVKLTAESCKASDGDGLMFYANVSQSSKVSVTVSAANSLTLSTGKSVQLLANDATEWTAVTVAADGTISFANAFEGWVKIPYEALNGAFAPENDAITEIAVKLSNSSKFDSAVLGAISLFKNVSASPDIVYPTEYLPKNPKDRIDYILDRSKKGIADAHYFIVGDSTRHLLGSPVFRLLRDTLLNEYNVNCHLQALAGLKAEYWSGHSPELQPGNPNVEGLISTIPGTGYNCIVDICLGINDGDKTVDEIASYLFEGINKIRAAKPDVTIVYTSPNRISSKNWDNKMVETTKKIAADDSIYLIDVHEGVMADAYFSYYIDFIHPNVEGYRAMAAYIKSCLFEGYTYDKIIDGSQGSNQLNLPDGATLNSSSLSVSKTLNISTYNLAMNVGGEIVDGIVISGNTEINNEHPFKAADFVETHLSEDFIGNDYLTFYISIPAANKIGVTLFTKDGTKENIFKNGVGYYILPDGETKWQKRTTTDGRPDGSETYGSLDFDSAFSGFVRLPLSNFYGSPSKDIPFNKVTLRFARVGASYGEIKLGAFLNMSDVPHTVKNPWKASNLPEMTPFTDVTKLDGHWAWVARGFVASPLPTLNASEKVAAKISCLPAADYGKEKFINSVHWMGMSYDNMPIGNFTHLVFYVRVPETKTNYLSLCMFTDTRFEFKVMVDMPYQLMAVGENEWSHFTAFKTINSYGGIELPAGFEGLVKVPIDSLLPANKVDSKTVLSEVVYRFAYCGTDEEAVYVGPMFGVTKDNDKGPSETILNSMPERTTIKSLFAVDKGDIFKDRIMLYWEEYPEADHYLMEAYEIIEEDGAKKYKLVSSSKTFTNSGTVAGLEPNTKYAMLIKAYSYDNRMIAVYDYITVTTAENDPYAVVDISEDYTLDMVYYPSSDKSLAGKGSVGLIIAIAGGAAVVLAAAVVLLTVFIKKRRHKADVK